jgi:hypothetical protein
MTWLLTMAGPRRRRHERDTTACDALARVSASTQDAEGEEMAEPGIGPGSATTLGHDDNPAAALPRTRPPETASIRCDRRAPST